MVGVSLPLFNRSPVSTTVHHEDPSIVKSPIDYSMLFTAMAAYFKFAGNRQYDDADSVLKEFRNTNVPANMKYVFTRYTTLLESLLKLLDYTEAKLDLATKSIESNNISDARKTLDEARASLNNVYAGYQEVRAITTLLIQEFGITRKQPTDPEYIAWLRLQEEMSRLQMLMDRLDSLQNDLLMQVQHVTTILLPVEITISIEPDTAYVGDNINISGKVQSSGVALAGRTVGINIGGAGYKATTDSDGQYRKSVMMPFIYSGSVEINSEFSPTGSDLNSYLAAHSEPIYGIPRFYSTELKVAEPGEAYPGISVSVSGSFDSDPPGPNRSVQLLLDGQRMSSLFTSGKFIINSNIPSTIGSGIHTLTVLVDPVGRFSGAAQKVPLPIKRKQISINTDRPSFFIVPGLIIIRGSASQAGLPVENARVEATWGEKTSTFNTGEDGKFTAVLPYSLDLTLVGRQTIDFTVQPEEPWLDSAMVTLETRTFNWVTIGLTFLIIALLSVLVRRQLKPAPLMETREQATTPSRTIGETPVITQPSIGKQNILHGAVQGVLAEYYVASELVARKTGLTITATMTIREYGEAVNPLLSDKAGGLFNDLGKMAEIELYSAVAIQLAAEKANLTVAELEKELDNATA